MRKNKATQLFSRDRVRVDRDLPKEEIARFLQEFTEVVHGDEGKRKLISLRVPEKLLSQFKKKAELKEVSYQTQIVRLMRDWVRASVKELKS